MLLRDNWPERGLIGPIGRELNKVAKILNGAVGFGGIQVFTELGGLEVYGGSGGSRTEGLWQPGEIDDDAGVITVGRGILIDNGRAYQVDEAPVIVESGTFDQPSYIYLEMPHGGEPRLANRSIDTFPVPDLDNYRLALIEVYLDQDQITIKERLCTQLVDITQLMSRFSS